MTATPNRRWYQFSLRKLFLAIAVLAVSMGIWRVLIAPVERQRVAVEKVRELGGRFWYAAPAGSESWPVSVLRRCVPRDYLDAVEGIDLSQTQTSDADLYVLRRLSKLQQLSLYSTRVTDKGLVHLEGLRNLRRLDVGKTQITDAGLVHLRGLTQCEWIALFGCTLTDMGVSDLQKALPSCDIRTVPPPRRPLPDSGAPNSSAPAPKLPKE